MSGKCMFCRCDAAPWPEYASQYASGYPLCHLHMGDVLDRAVNHKSMSPEHAKAKTARFLMVKPLLDLAGKIQHDVSDVMGEDFDAVWEAIYKITNPDGPFHDDLKVGLVEFKSLSDKGVDKAIAHRVKLMAGRVRYGQPVARCKAPDDNNLDGVCKNHASEDEGICGKCKAEGKRKEKEKPDEVGEIMSMIIDKFHPDNS